MPPKQRATRKTSSSPPKTGAHSVMLKSSIGYPWGQLIESNPTKPVTLYSPDQSLVIISQVLYVLVLNRRKDRALTLENLAGGPAGDISVASLGRQARQRRALVAAPCAAPNHRQHAATAKAPYSGSKRFHRPFHKDKLSAALATNVGQHLGGCPHAQRHQILIQSCTQ